MKLSEKLNLEEKVVFWACADVNNFKYGINFWKSMTKFHDPKEIDMLFYTNMKDQKELDKLPKGVQIVDLTPYLNDQMFFYRQKPIISEPLLEKYDLVVGFDVDQIVLAPLDDVINVKTYDVGVVINWNRFDPQFYPMVDLKRIGVPPIEYYNCGMVALRSKKFTHDWNIWCHSVYYDRCEYKEQDGLNIKIHGGNWNVWCFDSPSSKEANLHWFGLISKGELTRAIVEDDKIVIPQGLGDTPFPPTKVVLNMVHLAGGSGALKDNWNQFFQPEVMQYIEEKILK